MNKNPNKRIARRILVTVLRTPAVTEESFFVTGADNRI